MSTMKIGMDKTAARHRHGEWSEGNGLVARLGRFLARRRNRSELKELLRYDDRLLADIGLTRGDVEWALYQTHDSDGTEALASLRRSHGHRTR